MTLIFPYAAQTLQGKSKDTLAAHIPALRRSLESVVYRTQGMLEANNCGKAMTVGNLKNKDLEGNELSSQVMRVRVHAGVYAVI